MRVKKNILIVSPTKIGLTETFIRAHIDQLYGNVFYLYGWDLDFMTHCDVSLSELYRPGSSFLNKLKSLLPHYIYFRLAQKRKKNYTKEALISRYIQEHQIDVVLAEYGTAGSFITPICKSLNLPLLVHFHGFDASRKDILNTFKKGYQLMFSYATKIIVVSNAMKQALVGQGCPEKKLVLNTCGPHPDYLNIKPNLESNYIISVGRHTYKKAPYLTILAFQEVLKKHPYLKLKMIGDGELFDVSKNLVKSLGLENNIILLGALERQEIIKHLQSAFLFVQHSIIATNGDSEGTPVGIIEAMAAGLPLVSTRHAGIPDVVIENETGFLVDEGNIDVMAEQILTLLDNRDLAGSFGKKGNERILSEFTLQKHIATIDRLIEEIS
jgi:colanic acid/amylovoran biosynthesis glycosyltransferase